MIAHFEKLASSVNVPIVIYNFPGTTKVNMSPALIAKLADIPNIIGIKNSVDSFLSLRQILRSTRNSKKPFTVLAGIEDYLIPGMLLGIKGTISGFSNFMPKTLVQYLQLLQGRKVHRSRRHLQPDSNAAEGDGSSSRTCRRPKDWSELVRPHKHGSKIAAARPAEGHVFEDAGVPQERRNALSTS